MSRALRPTVIGIIALIMLGMMVATYFTFFRGNVDVGRAGKERFVGAATKMMTIDDNERRQRFQQWSREQLAFSSTTETSSALPFKLKSPKSPALAKPAGIYVTKADNPKERTAFIIGDGDPADTIMIQAISLTEKPDYLAGIQEDRENAKKNEYKGDRFFSPIDVNGHQGTGIEPGYNVVGGEKAPRPGAVSWWEDGVQYTIYGTRGPKGTPLQALLEIARSME